MTRLLTRRNVLAGLLVSMAAPAIIRSPGLLIQSGPGLSCRRLPRYWPTRRSEPKPRAGDCSSVPLPRAQVEFSKWPKRRTLPGDGVSDLPTASQRQHWRHCSIY